MRRLRDFLIDHLALLAAIVLFVVAVAVGIDTFINTGGGFREQFGANFSTELASIAITVIVIDQLYRVRSNREYKRQIINQMGSDVNDAALEAVRVAREKGWLFDGSLEKANLGGANLKGAELWASKGNKNYIEYSNDDNTDIDTLVRGANLKGADLTATNLEGAMLFYANLEGAMLTYANLEGAMLEEANLKGVNLAYANLKGSILRRANLKGAIMYFTKLTDAKYDDGTNWPSGFAPDVEGMKKDLVEQ